MPLDPAPAPQSIRLRGVRQNNLRNLNLDLPLGQLIVVTGLSGAGKSSLVFETLHAEGQRRYVETFSPYTRQFLEMMDRPDVDHIENIRPSIAIEQNNAVRTTRSTVGTMTELCDYFKVWFRHRARLIDPETGKEVRDDNPQSIWRSALASLSGQSPLLTFEVPRPENLSWAEILAPLAAQGYARILVGGGVARIDETTPESLSELRHLPVIQDRVRLEKTQESRFIEAATQALHYGRGRCELRTADGQILARYAEGLHSPETGRIFKPATANTFSFNSPVGACRRCRGFGRVIEVDPRLVIPDPTRSLEQGAIRAFTGAVYSESLRDLLRACPKNQVRTNVPWEQLSAEEQRFVWEGEPDYVEGTASRGHWYGVRRFFTWLESNSYKMHVRVFLSKYRAYVECPECAGSRLQAEALCWRWRKHTLPDLYRKPISELLEMLESEPVAVAGLDRALELATEAILTRLRYLVQVGLGYLTLDRSSRTLSGGETQRVNLTTCLGTALVDTLFVLDEPSIGLHARDTDRLIGVLRRLTAQGNTVVVVEHDEAVIRAADTVIEIGPRPGKAGGNLVYQGRLDGLLTCADSITGAYLSGRMRIDPPAQRRPIQGRAHQPWLRLLGVSKHNLLGIDVAVPLTRFVALSGVSGSGKSTLLDNVLHQTFQAARGQPVEDPAQVRAVEMPQGVCEDCVLVDQSPASRTPRSNPALYVGAWDLVRQRLATASEAQQRGLTASSFSFNSGDGRCPHCEGLGYERVEMQFMADVFTVCPHCEGRRFKPEVLAVQHAGKSVADILAMTVEEAVAFFASERKIAAHLQPMIDVGLGYLPLGQPLNTLSGGEAQRLKLVKFLHPTQAQTQSLVLLDEPTTGLHRDDVRRLLVVFQRLVDQGHSLVVIEHQPDILAAADWILELGPEAGAEGGQIIFAGSPEELAAQNQAATAPYLKALLNAANTATEEPSGKGRLRRGTKAAPTGSDRRSLRYKPVEPRDLLVAESGSTADLTRPPQALTVVGAREHNLKNLTVEIPHGKMTVVTGVSGSGKSSLAFDIIFAEGQRRFMESMSSWARQYVEQMGRPEIDRLSGIPPTVAIEQRITSGTSKSTVATITEVAQYLRLLFARLGVQYSPKTGQALVTQTPQQIAARFIDLVKADTGHRMQHLFAPVIRGRKGHHEPLARELRQQGHTLIRADGELIELEHFQKLDRFREHDIEVAVGRIQRLVKRLQVVTANNTLDLDTAIQKALSLGDGSAFVTDAQGQPLHWFSSRRTDPASGEAFPELDPKNFSWNSARGWCPVCCGYGALHGWMKSEERFAALPSKFVEGAACPDCAGSRLNRVSRAVYLELKGGGRINLPALLSLAPAALLQTLESLELDRRGQAILESVRPEIVERLRFLNEVGLDYLSLDRATNTLSGGEAQRIRLAAQLGSNLSGVLYVLDEPTIGLHARDNDKLLEALARLKAKGNTLLVVEHDEETMRAADHILDLGPGAGIHGGHLLAAGTLEQLVREPRSLTGQMLGEAMPHPLRGHRRSAGTDPATVKARGKSHKTTNKHPSAPIQSPQEAPKAWITLAEPRLRNLKGGELRLPQGRLIGVCGPSGAGKSTLLRDLLRPAVEAALTARKDRITGKECGLPLSELRGVSGIRNVVEVDQEPIGKTPRSTPATYIGAFDLIRAHFASLPEARMRGYGAGTFSFNTTGGRCATCEGAGRIKLEMSFMPETYVPCDDCGGGRYGRELLDLRWNGRNIAEVLQMSFEDAAALFGFNSRLRDLLGLMVETGLGYLTLGQSSPTLSGGEAQRLKLVSELAKGLPSYREKTRGLSPQNLYLLEEPTIGLHLSDCRRLIELLHRLVDQGHTVVVIEHHLDLLAEADWLVEIGPDGGERGGEILYQGTPEGILNCRKSITAPYLAPKLA